MYLMDIVHAVWRLSRISCHGSLTNALWRVSLNLELKCSFSDREDIPINVLKALVQPLYVQSPCNILNENYTEIFYMIDGEDIPSIQCKMRPFVLSCCCVYAVTTGPLRSNE